MKRNSLTTAVVAGIAGTVGIANLASAVNLNPDGVGQVLIYPYYTVNSNSEGNNLQTLFSVVNTTDQGKAVKVRFVEGYNSREVRDFHVYLSPYDVWTAALFKLPGQEQANLVTEDNSCTAPRIKGATGNGLGQLPDGRTYLPFTNSEFAGAKADGGPTGLARTREGHFEIIEMGVVTDVDRGSLTAITHGADGVPTNCQKIVNAWVQVPPAGVDNYWIDNPNFDMLPPSGGLFGSALLFDPGTGVSSGYSADAIDGFSIINLNAQPGSVQPSLTSANTDGAGNATALVFNNGSLIQATYGGGFGRPIDAVSAVFMHDNIFNEFVLGGIAAATTDWVVTFPTKRYYVDPRIVGSTAIQPFVEVFNGTSDVVVGLFPYNREEATNGDCVGSDADNPACGVCFSPCDDPVASVPVLSYESQVISFQTEADFNANSTSPVLGSALANNIDVRADFLNEGWLRIAFNPTSEPHQLSESSQGEVFDGLPSTGFAITNYVNANAAPGVLANYSGLWHHKGSRSCSAGGGTLACS